ncbi:transposase [Phormidesmis sp. 146-12]
MHTQCHARSKERIQLLYLLQSGQAKSVTHAAELLGRGRITLQRWLSKYDHGGMEELLTREVPIGRTCQIPEAAQAVLIERLSSPVGFSSYGEIQEWLKTEYDHEITYEGIHKHVCYRLGAKPKRPRPISTEQDPQKVDFFKRS